MRKEIKIVIVIILATLGFSCGMYVEIYKWFHVDMTSRRVFMNNWRICIIAFVALLSAGLLAKSSL